MLPSSLSGEEALTRIVHIFEQCNVKNDGGVLLRKKKSEKIAEMYIKKEKPDEKVLVKIKALFEWLVKIEWKSEGPKEWRN